MKKIILCLVVICSVLSVNAQQQGKFRGGGNFQIQFPGNGVGVGLDLDFRINIIDNMNVGARFGMMGMAKDANLNEESITATAMTYSLANANYYFNNGTRNFAPFIGGGIGTFRVANVFGYNNVTINSNSAAFERTLGGNVAVGFEAGKFRLGLEYFIIPNTSLRNESNVVIGKVRNSFLNLTLGFYIGGGKWVKSHQLYY